MIGLRLAFTLYNLGLTADAGAVARSALTRAERYGDQPLLAQALAVSTIVDFSLGLGLDEARLQRALELGDPDRRTGVELYPALIAAFVFLWSGRFDESRAHLSAVCAQHAARGEDHAFAWARFTAVWLETWSGDLVAASSAADEAWEGLRLLDTGNGNALALTARAQVDACAGRAQAARRGCREALAYFGNAGWQTWSWFPIVTLGFLELSVGDYEAAAGALEPLAAMAISTDLPDPAPAGMLFAGDAAEALVGVGRSEEAETITSLLEERGEALDRPWAIAVGARCRGLLLAAGGDVPGAEQALERALVTHERLPMPIERRAACLSSVAFEDVCASAGRPRRHSVRRSRSSRPSARRSGPSRPEPRSAAWAFAGARRTISRPRRSASPASRPRVSRTERWRHPFSSVRRPSRRRWRVPTASSESARGRSWAPAWLSATLPPSSSRGYHGRLRVSCSGSRRPRAARLRTRPTAPAGVGTHPVASWALAQQLHAP